MHTKDSAFKLARDILFGDPVTKQEERIEQAMLAVAKCHGDHAQLDKMLTFYSEQMRATDPYSDWWNYAARAQKFHDTHRQCIALSENIRRLTDNLEQLRNAP